MDTKHTSSNKVSPYQDIEFFEALIKLCEAMSNAGYNDGFELHIVTSLFDRLYHSLTAVVPQSIVVDRKLLNNEEDHAKEIQWFKIDEITIKRIKTPLDIP